MKKGGKSGTSEEDRALWRRVTRDVRAYGKQGGAAATATKASPSVRHAPAGKNAAGKTAVASAPPVAAMHARTAPRRPLPDDGTAQNLRRKKWPVDKTLDLHGMTQAAAYQALLRFVAAATRQEKRTLLVITGKGSRLAGGGVLRRLLPLWLEEAPLRARVLACTAARPEDGGEGAFYIRLRKKKD
jgi:DNA-nicking Smr family endonuclease